MINAFTNCPTEWSFTSGKTYANPFQDVTLDVVVTDPQGHEQTVPAFWAGDNVWRVRYAPHMPGAYGYRTVCSDTDNAQLHGVEGSLQANPYEGDNPLLQHGGLRVAENRRYLQHQDGTPFLWLGDTGWMSLCKRLEWPGEFKALYADRVAKGFSVIQIIAGLYPDMPAFDPRGANEAGFPWTRDYSTINPVYWDMADIRIDWLVRLGLLPCIVACWAYFLPWMGVDKLKQHWRHLIARYGAYPVVWCLAGEGAMPYYLSEDRLGDVERQKQGWTEIGQYVQQIDPYDRPVTIHPTDSARDQVNDETVLDFDFLQTGHSDRASMPSTIRLLQQDYAREPHMPMINSEVCYEGIGEACREEVQRYMFWSCMLSGGCGFTYGANGIWQLNRRDQPYGPSPHGLSWGDRPWDEAAQLPGSKQIGVGKKFLERYEWWRFEPHPEWVVEPATVENTQRPFAAGIPGEVRMLFLPSICSWGQMTLKALEPGSRYRAFLFDPRTGSEREIGEATPDENGNWNVPFVRFPVYQDWVMVLERI
jgi:hypothetical protein